MAETGAAAAEASGRWAGMDFGLPARRPPAPRWPSPAQGEAVDERYALRVERIFVRVRWLAVGVVVVAAPFANLALPELVATYAVAALGALYTLAVQLAVVRRPEWLSSSYLTSVADLPRLFEPFFRASNTEGTIAGLGLGLGLAGARQIVEQHGGTIAVTSQEGGGSTFTLRLPIGVGGPGGASEQAQR